LRAASHWAPSALAWSFSANGQIRSIRMACSFSRGKARTRWAVAAWPRGRGGGGHAGGAQAHRPPPDCRAALLFPWAGYHLPMLAGSAPFGWCRFDVILTSACRSSPLVITGITGDSATVMMSS
jgi:hypothetical protein